MNNINLKSQEHSKRFKPNWSINYCFVYNIINDIKYNLINDMECNLNKKIVILIICFHRIPLTYLFMNWFIK